MKIEKNLLVNTIHAPDREVRIPCQEIIIDTIDQEIAVRWKQAWHWKRTNEVGDGMEVLRVHVRPVIEAEIDAEWFLYGLSPWQEYDELTNKVKVYLYKFSKDQEIIDSTNLLIQELLPDLSLKVEGRFVLLDGVDYKLANPNDLLKESEELSLVKLLSFFYGLLIAYGEIKIEDELLHNCIIHIPLTGPMGMWHELFISLLASLRDKGIYVTQSLLAQREGQLLQITISDREFLNFVSHFLSKSYGTIKVSKYELFQQQKQNLLEFLSQHNTPAEIISELEHSVLKTVRK